MSDLEELESGPGHKDRSTGLVIFGVLQLLLGGLSALLIPLTLFSMAMTAKAPHAGGMNDLRMILPGLAFYCATAAVFVCLGIGSIRAKRWARALSLVSSWLWLICGTAAMLVAFFLLPDLFSGMAERGEVPQNAVRFIKVIMFGFALTFYLLLPGILVLFYRSPHVKATCEARNPEPSWTDSSPLPVLLLIVMFVMWGLSLIFTLAYGAVQPFFGTIVAGPLGYLLVLLYAAMLIWIEWGLFRLRRAAWWGALIFGVGWMLSAAITFARVGLLSYYEAMSFGEEQMEAMRAYNIWDDSWMVAMFVIWIAVFIAYLAYIRRFFWFRRSDGGRGLYSP